MDQKPSHLGALVKLVLVRYYLRFSIAAAVIMHMCSASATNTSAHENLVACGFFRRRLVTLLQMMCSGAQVDVLISQLRARASSCSNSSSSSSSAERVFAHEVENLSIEPVLLAQCVAHCISLSRETGMKVLTSNVCLDAVQTAEDLKRLLIEARSLSEASVAHCGGAMRHPVRFAHR